MEANHTSTNLFDRIARGDLLITLDCDGTIFDPWACCGKRHADGCDHLRADIMAKVANLRAEYTGAKLVILSWRGGMEGITRTWLAQVGIEVAAVFVPGGMDTRQLGAQNGGQVGFKVNVLRALAAAGIDVLTGFDDNADVVAAARAEGVPMLLAPRLATVEPWEWNAGYIGAPKPTGFTHRAPLGDLYNQKTA